MTKIRSHDDDRRPVRLRTHLGALRNALTKTRTAALIAVAAGVLAAGLPVLSAEAAAGNGTPADSNISFVGRWNKSNASAYVPYWAGAYLRVGFTGKTVKLRQRNTIQLWASIDGRAFTSFTGSGTINLTPTALAAGNHTLIVSYRQVAGSYTGDAVFQGLILDSGAGTFTPPARPKLVEFVGDSITAGATSSQLAVTDYGFKVGERLGYDHTQIAIGGMCLAETTDGCWAQATRYWMSSGGQAGTDQWDFSRYTADGVVINLGTNDKSHGVSAATFQATYTTFLTRIRAKFPNAKLFAMRTFIGRYAAETEAAVRARNAAGDANVFYVDTTGWLPSGGLSDSVHPNDAGHQAITDRLAPLVSAALTTTPSPTAAPTTPAPTTPAPTTPAPTTAAPTTPAGGACAVTYRKTGDWGTGAQFDVTLSNTSAVPVNGWTLTWSLPGSQRITQSWNSTVTQSGAAATAVNVSWNAVIPAAGSTSFGFVTDSPLDGATGFALNGSPCAAAT
ncbi:Esterase with cellulose binding domain [Micromonospora lupini str. Lupac 08]|uniref:Esterase with cellulose binding domain n=1 Tax=Micromonospora lupini str. Lupac 08 TaxID=1150864 RepID=I0L2D2_9ACTN|nr:Esterase with cellulose binding domain [Micromonospora lupini str. Lupac 08]